MRKKMKQILNLENKTALTLTFRFLNRDYWRPHSFLHKRSALPFTDEEESIHSFRKPAEGPQTPMKSTHFKHSRNITEMRTNKDITLHVH